MDPRVDAFFDYCEELVLECAVEATRFAERMRRTSLWLTVQDIRNGLPHELARSNDFARLRDVVFQAGLRRLLRSGMLRREADPGEPNRYVYRVTCSVLERIAMAARAPENEVDGP